MNILIIKSIFCPNEIFLQKMFDSIIKIDTYTNLFDKNNKYNLLLVGWCNQQENSIDLFIELLNPKLNISKIYWPINYGKYKLFNDLKVYADQNIHQCIIYLDHDIYFDFNFNTMMDINEISKLFLEDEIIKIGLIAFNQKIDVRHQSDIYDNQLKINNINICWPNTFGSIACGAFMINPVIINKLSDIALVSVYGLDDVALVTELNNNCYKSIVLENYYVVHPFTDNYIYNKWKYDMVMKLISGTNINYYQTIEDANNLWC